MYKPMVAILVAAENATELPRLGKPRKKLRVHASHTMDRSVSQVREEGRDYTLVRMGDLRLASTLWKNLCPGIPPSRAKAYIMRLLDVTEKVPQKHIATITITWVWSDGGQRRAE